MGIFECKLCNKTFDTKDALNQHNKTKHGIKEESIKPKIKFKKYIFYSIIALILILIIYFGIIPLFNKPDYTPLLPQQEHIKGDPNAPSTIIEFSDFQCPFCEKFWSTTLLQLEAEYINAGKAKFIYKHLPLTRIHGFAFKAAEASECAADQGKFWEYQDILFERQDKLSKSNLKSYAKEIGLDTTLFDACLDSGVMSERVRLDIAEATKRGVSSTPIFFVNDQKVEGAQPFAVFKSILG